MPPNRVAPRSAYPGAVPFTACPPPEAHMQVYPPMGKAAQGPPPTTGGASFAVSPPWEVPPFRAIPFDQYTRFVLNAPSGSMLGVAGAASIAIAENIGDINGGSSPLTTFPTVALATNVEETVLTVQVPGSLRLRVAGWGAEIGHASFESVKFRLAVGPNHSTNKLNLAAFSSLEDLAPIYALAMGDQSVQVFAQNNDMSAPHLVTVRLYGWYWPTLQQDDSVRSALGDNPFAIDSNGRFGQAACPPEPGCPPRGACR